MDVLIVSLHFQIPFHVCYRYFNLNLLHHTPVRTLKIDTSRSCSHFNTEFSPWIHSKRVKWFGLPLAVIMHNTTFKTVISKLTFLSLFFAIFSICTSHIRLPTKYELKAYTLYIIMSYMVFFPHLQWILVSFCLHKCGAHAKWIEGIAIYFPQLIAKYFIRTQNVKRTNFKIEFLSWCQGI